MKKKIALISMAVTMLAMSMTGCGKKAIKVDGGEVKLCEYKGIPGELKEYKVSEEDLEEWKNNMLEEYSTENEVDRAAKEDDYVTVNMTATADGQVVESMTDEGVEIGIGFQEYGEELDEALIGKSKGDKFSVAADFDENWDEDVANKTVNFDVEVVSVGEYIEPELDEKFITETLGYESEDAFNADAAKQVQEYYANDNKLEAQSELIQYIVDNSEFLSYSDETYASCKEELESEYTSFGEMFGCSTIEEVYEMMEMTEEDIEKEIINRVYTRMVIHAIAEKEKISLSDEEYATTLEEQAQINGYESGAAYEEDYLKEDLMDEFVAIKVRDFIFDNAKIKTVETSAEDDTEEYEISDTEE